MHSTPVTTPVKKTSAIDALRLQLTEADSKRREILSALFLQYPHDTAPIIKTLIAEANASTLQKIEFLLSVDLPKECDA
jgi:hypothetical protein